MYEHDIIYKMNETFIFFQKKLKITTIISYFNHILNNYLHTFLTRKNEKNT